MKVLSQVAGPQPATTASPPGPTQCLTRLERSGSLYTIAPRKGAAWIQSLIVSFDEFEMKDPEARRDEFARHVQLVMRSTDCSTTRNHVVPYSAVAETRTTSCLARLGIGILEYWNTGMLEYWNIARLGFDSATLPHHSNIPAIQHSAFFGLSVAAIRRES